jgi:hypothetical protein
MIESPLIQEIIAENRQADIVRILKVRFREVPSEVLTPLRGITKAAKLDDLVDYALACPDLNAFRARLHSCPDEKP